MTSRRDRTVAALWAELESCGEVVRRTTLRSVAGGLVTGVLLAALGVGCIVKGLPWLGVPLVVLFVPLVVVVAWRQAAGRRTVLRVDPTGVRVDDHHVPWTAVLGVSLFVTRLRGIPTARVVVLQLSEAGDGELMAGRSGTTRALRRTNDRLLHGGRRSFELPVGTGLDARALAEWLEQVRLRASRRRW